MKYASGRSHQRRGDRRGFTLVELLVVIVVIGLLITILIPAVNAVRRSAKETTTRGAQATIGTALATYKADGRIGGGYPPSRSDADGTNLNPGQVANPYNAQWSSSPNPLPDIGGAGLLVWALAGADLQGCPGFRPFRTGNSFWSDDTDAVNSSDNPPSSGAYALNSQTMLPLHARAAPFVDLSKVQVSRANAAREGFEIEAETEARDEMGLGSSWIRDYPLFLDSFGYPILYWRADPAGVQMADMNRTATGSNRGVYHWIDNSALIQSDGDERLVLRPGNETHRLDWDTTLGRPGQRVNYSPGYFQYYIENNNIQARNVSHNADSYLLMSPGVDGLYGTTDDIGNFEHNGTDQTSR